MVTKRVVLEYQYAIMIEKCDGHIYPYIARHRASSHSAMDLLSLSRFNLCVIRNTQMEFQHREGSHITM